MNLIIYKEPWGLWKFYQQKCQAGQSYKTPAGCKIEQTTSWKTALPETNSNIAPENQWLEDEISFRARPIIRVSGANC